MASPRQVEPPTRDPGSSSTGDLGPSHRAEINELREALDALIADGERCRARVAAVNPETGQYRIILRERWRSRTAAGHPDAAAGSSQRPARRFTIQEIPALERAEAAGDSLRSRLAAMLASSRSVAVRLDDVDPDAGEIRIVLQGTLVGGPPEAGEEEPVAKETQDATRKLKSLIESATRSS